MKSAFACLAFILLFSAAVEAAEADSFYSPENMEAAIAYHLLTAERSVRIATYTFDSNAIAAVLKGLGENVADIKMLVEGSPVGGFPEASKTLLCSIASGRLKVRLYKGPLKFLHAKYAVIDSKSLLVLTENFGDYKNRGWGMLVSDREAAEKVSEIFDRDFENSEEIKCSGNEEVKIDVPETNYIPDFHPAKNISIAIAPENSISSVLNLINSANKSLYIEQYYIHKFWGGLKGSIEKSPNVFLEAAIKKAREGIDVKILLDGSEYTTTEAPVSNLQTVNYVNWMAGKENLSLEARLADMESLGVSSVHTKGLIIDNKTALVSSINWNENSPKNNRELGLILEGPAAAYFTGLFLRGWEGIKSSAPEGVARGPVEAGKSISDYYPQIYSMALFIATCTMFLTSVSLFKRRFKRL